MPSSYQAGVLFPPSSVFSELLGLVEWEQVFWAAEAYGSAYSFFFFQKYPLLKSFLRTWFLFLGSLDTALSHFEEDSFKSIDLLILEWVRFVSGVLDSLTDWHGSFFSVMDKAKLISAWVKTISPVLCSNSFPSVRIRCVLASLQKSCFRQSPTPALWEGSFISNFRNKLISFSDKSRLSYCTSFLTIISNKSAGFSEKNGSFPVTNVWRQIPAKGCLLQCTHFRRIKAKSSLRFPKHTRRMLWWHVDGFLALKFW